jgi:hypothetical protein
MYNKYSRLTEIHRQQEREEEKRRQGLEKRLKEHEDKVTVDIER